MDERYRRYRDAKLKLRDEAREAARRERVERILNRVPGVRRGTEVRYFTQDEYERLTREATATQEKPKGTSER